MNTQFLTGEITSIAFGGQGIMRVENLVVFVPFTAPGDKIICRITKHKGNFAFGEVVEFLERGKDVVPAPCPVYGRCGGCQLQHLDYSAQVSAKAQSVVDALERIGKLSLVKAPTIIPANTIWAYRRHVTLQLSYSPSATYVGYTEIDNTTLVPVSYCPIFTEKTDLILEEVQRFVRTLSFTDTGRGRVTIYKQLERFVLHFQLSSSCIFEEAFIKALKQHPRWAGILLTIKGQCKEFGDIQLTSTLPGLKIHYPANAFMQNHPEQSVLLYETMLSSISHLKPQTALDLYCGVGITSLMLAKLCKKVEGIEYNRHAIRYAQENARTNSISNVSFACADVGEVLAVKLQANPDFVLVNPPRDGLENKVKEALLRAPPSTLAYISCMPPTLSRDLHQLSKVGYHIFDCTIIDMFPHTAHVETLVTLTR